MPPALYVVFVQPGVKGDIEELIVESCVVSLLAGMQLALTLNTTLHYTTRTTEVFFFLDFLDLLTILRKIDSYDGCTCILF